MEDSGLFGDSSGAMNALFSALAFAGVIFAIILQKKELELQREELEQTREELKGQKKELIQQNDTLRRQRFENTFFQMMSSQQEIVNTLSYSNPQTKGRDVFKVLYEYSNVFYIDVNESIISSRSLKEALGKKYYSQKIESVEILSQDNNKPGFDYSPYNKVDQPQYLDHYFRHLYRMVKFVDETKLLPDNFDERYQYTSMIRATLSRYELVWLFYNGLSENGVEKFKPLIEKYALLRGLRLDMLAIPEETVYYEKLLTENLGVNSKYYYARSAFVKTL